MLQTKSLLPNNPKEQGRTAQASLKAMNAAQKKAEQLGIYSKLAPYPLTNSSTK